MIIFCSTDMATRSPVILQLKELEHLLIVVPYMFQGWTLVEPTTSATTSSNQYPFILPILYRGINKLYTLLIELLYYLVGLRERCSAAKVPCYIDNAHRPVFGHVI